MLLKPNGFWAYEGRRSEARRPGSLGFGTLGALIRLAFGTFAGRSSERSLGFGSSG